MATLKLNTGGPLTGANSPLRPTGAPAPRLRLKGANGQPIAPKPAVAKPAAAKSAAAPKPAPAPAADDAAAKAAEEAAAAAAAKAAEEAAAAAAAEAEAQAAAEAEAQRLAQEEYERQMEEYNRQMEEYNRQMAEYKAAEEAAAKQQAEALAAASAQQQAEAEALAAAAAAQELTESSVAAEAAAAKKKLAAAVKPAAAKPAAAKTAAKPAGAKPAGGKIGASALGGSKPAGAKKKAAAAAPSPEEAEQAARDAYLSQLQADADRIPIWKTKPFLIGCGLLVIFACGCGYFVMQDQAKKERVRQHQAYIKKLLLRAQAINQKGVETVAQAKAKGVDITCTKKDAKALLEVVVDPFAKAETGKPLWGNAPKGVAQNACLLLGLAAEQEAEIDALIFDTLGQKCRAIDADLFHWMLQRVAVSDGKDVNAKLHKLAATVTAAPDWSKKTDVLSYIWEAMGLRVTEKDVPEILALLADPKTEGKLINNLNICLDNILEMMDDADKKQKIGDEIFTKLNEKQRRNMVTTLAKACSGKALEFYKNELKDRKTWKRGSGLTFLGYWGDDSILDYVLELQETAKGDESDTRQVNEVIGTIFRQNRERSDADAAKLLDLYFGDVFQDTTKLQDIINKTDPDSTLFVGAGSAELEKLKEERKKLEAARGEKMRLIKSLASLRDYKWVTNILDRLAADKDDDVATAAKKAQETVKKNTVEAAAARDEYNARGK